MSNKGYTYLLEQDEYLKIGFTLNLKQRLSQYNTHSAKSNMLYFIKGNEEKSLHEKFKNYNYRNEWFYYSKIIIEYFKEKGFCYPTNKEEQITFTTKCIKDICSLSPQYCFSVFSFLCTRFKNYDLFITRSIRNEIQQACNICRSSVTLAINALNKHKFIIRLTRGRYIFNPKYVLFDDTSKFIDLLNQIDIEPNEELLEIIE